MRPGGSEFMRFRSGVRGTGAVSRLLPAVRRSFPSRWERQSRAEMRRRDESGQLPSTSRIRACPIRVALQQDRDRCIDRVLWRNRDLCCV